MFNLPSEVDFNDALLGPLAVAGAAVMTDFASVTIANYDLAGEAFAISEGISVSIAGAIALLAFLTAFLTNDVSVADLRSQGNEVDSHEVIVFGAPLVMILVELFDEVYDIVASEPWIAGTVTLAVSAAFYVVAHR